MSSYYLRRRELFHALDVGEWKQEHARLEVWSSIDNWLPRDEYYQRVADVEWDGLMIEAEAENGFVDLERERVEGWFDAEIDLHSRVLKRRDHIARLKAMGAWYGRPAEVEFGWRYAIDGWAEGPCEYCASGASGWDHVPPLFYVAGLSEGERSAIDMRVVRCCARCNARLGRRQILTVEARKAFLCSQEPRPGRSEAETKAGR